MIRQTPGRLYLAEQHGTVTTAQSSRRSVLSFGPFQNAQRPAEGRLLAFNEETLGGGQQLTLPAPRAAYCVLVPLTGEIGCGDELSQELVQVEEIWLSRVPAGRAVVLTNPYAGQAVRFLHLWLTDETDETPRRSAPARLFRYTFQQLEGKLAEVLSSPELPFALSLGRLQGRQEALYQPRHPEDLFFAYVLAGAFEIEGRLLHAHDGLTLRQAPEIELEALSNNALVVVISC